MEILSSCSDCDEIQFKEDGSWCPMRSKKDVQEVSASYNGVAKGMLRMFLMCGGPSCINKPCVSGLCFFFVVVVDLSRTETNEQKRSSNGNNRKVDIIDLTQDSSSDEDDEEPPPKRPCPSLSPVSPPLNKG